MVYLLLILLEFAFELILLQFTDPTPTISKNSLHYSIGANRFAKMFASVDQKPFCNTTKTILFNAARLRYEIVLHIWHTGEQGIHTPFLTTFDSTIQILVLAN